MSNSILDDTFEVEYSSKNSLFSNREFQPLVVTPPSPQCQVCVIVPVKDEAENIQHTLLALSDQTDLNGYLLDPARYEIILLANNCSDNSAAIARSFARQHSQLALHIVERTIPPAEACIGRVRQMLMDEACHRLMALGHPRGVIASTDGDTQVASDWIAATRAEIAGGADAVGGRIITQRNERAKLPPYARACYLREVGYRFGLAQLETYLDPDWSDPWPRHYQYYGASMAITPQIYLKIGGLPERRTSEDVALYHALKRNDARICHSPRVRVTTSARQVGRTEGGLANQLTCWKTMGQEQQPFLVESAGAIEAQLQRRFELRQLWQQMLNGNYPSFQAIALSAQRLGISTRWLAQEMENQTFGALWEQIEQRQQQQGIWQQGRNLVEIERAIADLRLRLERLRRQHLKTASLVIQSQPSSNLQTRSQPAQTDRDDIELPFELLDAAV